MINCTHLFFICAICLTRRSSHFPYTTLFRSSRPDLRDESLYDSTRRHERRGVGAFQIRGRVEQPRPPRGQDRKSTRLNSSHLVISYAVFCLKKKKAEKNNLEDKKKEDTKEPA